MANPYVTETPLIVNESTKVQQDALLINNSASPKVIFNGPMYVINPRVIDALTMIERAPFVQPPDGMSLLPAKNIVTNWNGLLNSVPTPKVIFDDYFGVGSAPVIFQGLVTNPLPIVPGANLDFFGYI